MFISVYRKKTKIREILTFGTRIIARTRGIEQRICRVFFEKN